MNPILHDDEQTQTISRLDGLTLCLVEDDPSAIKVYTRWLHDAGANVVPFATLGDFQRALSSQASLFSPQGSIARVAITDLILPDGTGLEAVKLWKKHFPSLPILVTTAFATVENAVEAMKLGAFDFLRKPIQQEEFILVLQRAIDYVKLLDENETLASSVRVLGMAQTLSQINDRVGLLKTFGRLLHRETHVDECYVFHFEMRKARPECLLECRAPGLPRVGPEIIHSTILHDFLEEGNQKNRQATESPPTAESELFCLHEIPEHNALIVELRSQTGNAALIVLVHRPGSAQIKERIADMMPVVIQASRGFQNADVATALSFVDDLTGLYNQRFLFVALKNEVARANRYGIPVSVLFIDLDRFKEINDTHGHMVGSQMLRESSTVFRASVRETDFLLRYGGDEFVAILPNTNIAGATAVAERIRNAFASTSFDVRESTGVSSAFDLRVTTSIGVASYPECASTFQELVQKADNAMYEAKRSGKNRISVVPATNPVE